jgi:hypothetical protein
MLLNEFVFYTATVHISVKCAICFLLVTLLPLNLHSPRDSETTGKKHCMK